MPENKHIRFLLVIAYITIGYFALTKVWPLVWPVLAPFIFAFIMASIATPLANLFKNKLHFPQWLATGTSIISIWVSVLTIAYFILNKLVTELIQFFSQMPTMINKFSLTLRIINIKWAEYLQTINPDMVQYLNNIISQINSMLISLIEPVTQFTINSATSIASSIPSAFIFAVAFILSCIFMTNDYENLKRTLMNQFTIKTRQRIREIKKYTIIAIKKYLRGMGVILLITFFELFLGLTILKVKYAFPIALLTALVDIFPVFGTGTILIPWGIITLLSGDYKFAIGIGIIYAVITVIRQFIEPKVMSKSLGTNPLFTLFSMYVGLKLFGVFGMILGPITSVIILYLQNSGVIHIWKTDDGGEAEDIARRKALAEAEKDKKQAEKQ